MTYNLVKYHCIKDQWKPVFLHILRSDKQCWQISKPLYSINQWLLTTSLDTYMAWTKVKITVISKQESKEQKLILLIVLKKRFYQTLREKCPSTEFFLVRISLYSDYFLKWYVFRKRKYLDFIVHADGNNRYSHSVTKEKVLERLQEILKDFITQIVS